MRKVAVVTGTRAEYGLLKNTLEQIDIDNNLELQLIVTGTHISKKYGYTIQEIVNDGFNIKGKIPILMDSNDGESIAKSMGLALIQFSEIFSELKPDIILIVGDRYEIFAVASTAMAMNIPIAHIAGGESTEGATDQQIRHAITKMAHIHFPSTKYYAENIRKMGEESWRIFNIGALGIENIKKMKLMNKHELLKDLNIEIDRNTLLVTYHPVTLEISQLHQQVDNLINALNSINKKMIITYPNSDQGGKYIIHKLEELKNDNKNVHIFPNLGSRRYLSIMKLCGAVVGNSSSAIVEAPYLKIPVVNIGTRQKGRLMSDNIIECGYSSEQIIKAIHMALSDEFYEKTQNIINLYGQGDASKKIVHVLKNIQINDKLLKKKLIWS